MNPDPTPSAPAPAASKFGVTLADVLVAGGALIILLFSWGRVVSYRPLYQGPQGLVFATSTSGPSLWSWLRPLGIFVILAALGLIATAAIDTWWKRDKQVVGLHRHHVQVGLALYALVTIFGMMLAGGAGVSVGWGGIIQFLGALVAATGAILNHFNLLQNKLELPARGAKPATYPPAGVYQTGYAAPPAQGYPAQAAPGYAPPAQSPAPADPNMPPASSDPTTPIPPQH
jgi:hypothetical protein